MQGLLSRLFDLLQRREVDNVGKSARGTKKANAQPPIVHFGLRRT